MSRSTNALASLALVSTLGQVLGCEDNVAPPEAPTSVAQVSYAPDPEMVQQLGEVRSLLEQAKVEGCNGGLTLASNRFQSVTVTDLSKCDGNGIVSAYVGFQEPLLLIFPQVVSEVRACLRQSIPRSRHTSSYISNTSEFDDTSLAFDPCTLEERATQDILGVSEFDQCQHRVALSEDPSRLIALTAAAPDILTLSEELSKKLFQGELGDSFNCNSAATY